MTTPLTPPADAVARLTAQMLDPWERVRCLPRCRSDEPMNHGECDCGSQQFVSDLRALIAAYADAARDRERLDWLERNTRVTESHEYPWPEAYRDESHSTLRAAIDAARIGEAR